MTLRKTWTVVRQLAGNHGIGWVVTRLFYELQVRSGWHQLRFRRRLWQENEFANWLRPDVPTNPVDYAVYRHQHSPTFFFRTEDRPICQRALDRVLGEAGRGAIVEEAEQLRQGLFSYFFARVGRLGFPPDWCRNPFTGQQVPSAVHWSRVPVFSPETGDLKFIWEPGRFASAFLLARAYWVGGDESHVETFWQLVESWVQENPPNQGPHWRCGQEIALRLMAWCFALFAFADSPATTPERLALMVGAIAVQADRIAGDHLYARLQGNNHAISEGMGLWTVGILFPELEMAGVWREAGRKILEQAARRQIYDDGAYVQHSINYHRLMLHDYLWSIRLGELNGYSLSPGLRDRVGQAAELLYQLQEEKNGYVPNYGANDGALILPLNGCDYRDFRPVLGSMHYLLNQTRLYQPGPWDEDLIWLFGPDALEENRDIVVKSSWEAPRGGYYTLRGERSWGVVRCATFQDRPSHADMLHLDIWNDGVNVACDPGTFVYYATPPWDNGLTSTLVHNTVSVDAADQMERGPRFLWLTWLQSQLLYHLASEAGGLKYLEGEHSGYARLSQPVRHRRAILRTNQDIWIVVDDLSGGGEHDLRLHWLLADFPFTVDAEENRVSLTLDKKLYTLRLFVCLPETVSGQLDVIRGTEQSAPRGWQSLYYGVRHPVISVAFGARTKLPSRLVSVFEPEVSSRELHVSAQQIAYANSELGLMINLLAPESQSVMQDVLLDGALGREHLVIR